MEDLAPGDQDLTASLAMAFGIIDDLSFKC